MNVRDARTVYDLLTEKEETLEFDLFQTPEDLIYARLPDNLTIRFTPAQGGVLLKILNQAAVKDQLTYGELYQMVQNVVTGGGSGLAPDADTSIELDRTNVIALLRALKLTDAKIINARLGVYGAMWSLRQDIMKMIGIREIGIEG